MPNTPFRLSAGRLLVAVVTLSALVGLGVWLQPRKDDGTFSRSIAANGDERFVFTSAMSPALPDASEYGDAFSDVLNPLGLKAFANRATVEHKGATYRWSDSRGWSVIITAKTCRDGVACVDSVTVHPDGENRLRNLARIDARARFVAAADYPHWPFVPTMGLLRCHPPKAVSFTTADAVYALNPQGRSADTRDIREILHDDPLRPGHKLPYGPIFFDAIKLCDGPGGA